MHFTTSGWNLFAQKHHKTAPRGKGDNLAVADNNPAPLFTHPHTMLAIRE